MYGITETTVHVTYRPLRPADLAAAGSVDRRARSRTSRVYLLDARLAAGAGRRARARSTSAAPALARGYLGRPELTAERFVPDPFGGGRARASTAPATWPAAWPDGDLEYLGRIDHQVKIRGFRIELGEIEAALAAHPAVREAVVLAREDGAGRPAAGGLRGAGRARRRRWPSCASALGERLPDYMVPVGLRGARRAAADRQRQGGPPGPAGAGGGAGAAAASRVAPRTPLERFLAALWREVLERRRGSGVDDDFFALGGNSITGAVLINRLQEALGEIVHVVAIFDAPTVAELAAYLVEQHPEAVARLFGPEALGGRGGRTAAAEPVGEAELARAAEPVRPLPPLPRPCGPKNPPAVFVLSPPRSGSTLLRVMLGGHPRLFAPPELELLSFNTLARAAGGLHRPRRLLAGRG